MTRPASQIALTADQRTKAEGILRHGTHPAYHSRHARILLEADTAVPRRAHRTDAQVATRCGVSAHGRPRAPDLRRGWLHRCPGGTEADREPAETGCRPGSPAGGAGLLGATGRVCDVEPAAAGPPCRPGRTAPALNHLPDLLSASTEETGHGRQQERREVRLTAEVAGLGDWPGVQQAFRLVRTWHDHGQERSAVTYGITSLSPTQAGPAAVLQLRREHWTIENRLHRQKDVHCGEDASQMRYGTGPAVLATLRDAAITLIYHDHPHHLAARTRALSQFPHHALAMVCRPLVPRA